MPFSFPIPEDEIRAAEEAVEDSKTRHLFDDMLADLLGRRAIYYRRAYLLHEYQNYVDRALPEIRRYVDAQIRTVICAQDLLAGHDQTPRETPVYAREDKVKSSIRKIINDVYGNNIGRAQLRKKESGCMMVICYILNTRPEFK